MIGIQTSQRNGSLVGVTQVTDADELMLISDTGTLVRIRSEEISVMGRSTQGVRLIRVDKGQQLVGLATIPHLENGKEP